jgi:hypothetical protein
MRRPILHGLSALSLVAAAFGACQPETTPSYAANLCGYLVVGNATVTPQIQGNDGTCPATFPSADGSATLTVNSVNPQFNVLVTAPAGPWQVSVATQGSLATLGAAADGGSVAVASATQDISGGTRQVPVAFPLSVLAQGGTATIQVEVGGTSQSFAFFAGPATPPSPTTCLKYAPGTTATRVAWSVDPPPVTMTTDDNGTVVETTAMVGTLVVDLEATLYDCSGGGDGTPFAKGVVSVAGTGGLAPTAPTATADSMGTVTVELTGPAVPNMASAVLTTAAGGRLVASVSAPVTGN